MNLYIFIIFLFSFSALQGAGELIWKYRISDNYGDNTTSPIIAYNGNEKFVVIVADKDGDNQFWGLLAFNPDTGELKWRYESKDFNYYSNPLYYDGVIFVPGSNSYLYAINTSDHSLKWKHYGIGESCSCLTPEIFENYLFYGSYGIYGLNRLTGKEIWRISNTDLFFPPKFYNSSIYCVEGYYFRIRKYNDGSVIKEIKNITDSEMVLWKGKFYFVRTNDGIHQYYKAMNSDTSIYWEYELDEYFETTACRISNDRLYFGRADSYLYCLNTNNGALIWKSVIGDSVGTIPCIAQDVKTSKETIFIGSYLCYLHARDASDGKHLWVYKTNKPLLATPCVSDSIVYFTSSDGYLFAVNIGFKDGFNNKQTSHHLPFPSLSVYPNPFRDRLTIESSDKARIYSITGQFITELDKGKHSIDTSKWREGVYIVKAGKECKRVVKVN